MKRVSVNVNQMAVFVIINNAGRMMNAGVNAKNYLIKVYKIKDLFGIKVIVTANVTNHLTLESIQTMKAVSAEKSQWINKLRNVLKMLKN